MVFSFRNTSGQVGGTKALASVLFSPSWRSCMFIPPNANRIKHSLQNRLRRAYPKTVMFNRLTHKMKINHCPWGYATIHNMALWKITYLCIGDDPAHPSKPGADPTSLPLRDESRRLRMWSKIEAMNMGELTVLHFNPLLPVSLCRSPAILLEASAGICNWDDYPGSFWSSKQWFGNPTHQQHIGCCRAKTMDNS